MAPTTRSPQTATRLIAWIGVWLLAGLAWIPTVRHARGMLSTSGTMGLSLTAFLGFWTVMMAAMMLPTLAPLVTYQLEAVHLKTRGLLLRAVRVCAFVLGYLLVWSAVGLPLYALAVVEASLIRTAPTVALEGGAMVLVAAGCYQCTPLQAACLASCHQLQSRWSHRWHTPPSLHDVATGIAHGRDCLGACGGLMLVFVLVGFMNLAWMLVISLIVLAEKRWQYGQHLALLVGMGLLLLGIVAAGAPGLLPGTALGAVR